MQNMSRQDLQNMLDAQRRWLLDRLLCKNDYLTYSGQFRDKIVNQQFLWYQDTKQMIKQVQALNNQLVQRNLAVESRLAALEQYIRELQHSLAQSVAANQRSAQATTKPAEPTNRRWFTAFEGS